MILIMLSLYTKLQIQHLYSLSEEFDIILVLNAKFNLKT